MTKPPPEHDPRNVDRQRQKQELEASGRVSGGIAHDFNNLLTIIVGYTNMLIAAPIESELHREYLREIQHAASRATELTRQLLTFSRNQMVASETLDLNEFVADTLSFLDRLLGENVEIATKLAPDLHGISADRSDILQILLNLATCARDAMPKGGKLTIETQNVASHHVEVGVPARYCDGDHVRWTFSFLTCGMCDSAQQPTFQPVLIAKEMGTGAGFEMAAIHRIVSRCEGCFHFISEPEQGTCFQIFLPRATS